MWFSRNNLRRCRRKLFPKGSQLVQLDCVHCQATMHQVLFHYPAPNFGKTFCRPITFGQSWTFGRASSLSEIGGWEKTLRENIMHLDCLESQDRLVRCLVMQMVLFLDRLSIPRRVTILMASHYALVLAWMHHAARQFTDGRRLLCRPASINLPSYTWAGLPKYRMAGCQTCWGTFWGPVGTTREASKSKSELWVPATVFSFGLATTENAPVAPKTPVPVSTVPVMFRISSLCH